MTENISVPVWLALIGGALALWALMERLLIPSVRWFFRQQVNLVISELNTRLQLQVPVFHRTKRQVLIDRLTYDPEVAEAVEDEVRRAGTPREVLFREVERYAREIVPSFNAYLYFRIGYRLARRSVRLLYRLRLGYADDEALSRIEPDASVVFVMNHRSNVDYVIVAYMAANRSALSYAVGEWARVWPLQALIRSLGAYFVRRNSDNRLYRRVLARYVQAATAGGVVQAVYPEGGLSRDGRMRPPKLGLISYMVSAFDPEGARDLVFVPVGINYDRVLEDRSLVRCDRAGKGGRSRVIAVTLGFVARNLRLMLHGRWYRFGYACVNFAAPLSMRAYTARHHVDFRTLGPQERRTALEGLGAELQNAIAATIPGASGLGGGDGVRAPALTGNERARGQGRGLDNHGSARRARRLRPHSARGPRLRNHGRASHAGAAALRRGERPALPGTRTGAGHAALLRQLDRALPRRVRTPGFREPSAQWRCFPSNGKSAHSFLRWVPAFMEHSASD